MSDTISSGPNFRIIKEGSKFLIQSDEGFVYGQYDKKDQAEMDLELWNEYYTAPLIFGNPHD